MVEEEIRRVVWVVKMICNYVDVFISIDIINVKVVEEVIKVGVDIINDVIGLKGDFEMFKVVVDYGIFVVFCVYGEVRNFSDLVCIVMDFF